MSAPEPLTPARLERIGATAQALVAAFGLIRDLAAAPAVLAEWGLRIAERDVPALLAEIGWLAAALADEQAAHAKTLDNFEIALGLDDGESMTGWRAEYDRLPLGTYMTERPAREHCEALARREHPADTALAFDWIGADDPEEPHELCVTVTGAETSTGYTVVPVPLLTVYYPDGDE